MFLPPQYFWLEPVIVAAVVVFVIDLIGNTISIQQSLPECPGDDRARHEFLEGNLTHFG